MGEEVGPSEAFPGPTTTPDEHGEILEWGFSSPDSLGHANASLNAIE